MSLLQVSNLTVALGRAHYRAVNDVSFSVAQGEMVALVGESGSGKSVLLQSLLGVLRGRPGVLGGQVNFTFSDGTQAQPYLGVQSARQLQARFRPLRGRRVGLVLQNGRASLDPFWTIGKQIDRAVKLRHALSSKALRARTLEWLHLLGFTEPARVAASHAHALSGGMAQRAMLAAVLAAEPELLLLDEITTGLDVSLQAELLVLLRLLHQRLRFSAIVVTHDLGLARGLSSRTLIMEKGALVQTAETAALFGRQIAPAPYTAQLLAAGAEERMERAELVADLHLSDLGRPPLAEVIAAQKSFRRGWRGRTVALAATTLGVRPGEALALVGESGSGKTTLARLFMGLLAPDSGKVSFAGHDLSRLDATAAGQLRKRRALLFQNPYTSIHPQMTPETLVAEQLELHQSLSRAEATAKARALLIEVGLEHRLTESLGRLSGGERRRVGLVRALESSAELLLLDEPTAGLDAVHRALVRRLIWRSRQNHPRRALVIVTHDLGFVAQVVDRIAVFYRGQLVEEGDVVDFFDALGAHHPYTRRLWAAFEVVAGHTQVDATVFGAPQAPDASEGGCRYRGRCPIFSAGPTFERACTGEVPLLYQVSARRRVGCHGVNSEAA